MPMTLVSTVTVGAGGASSIQFSGIAQTGKDLLCVVSARESTNDGNQLLISFNSDSVNANYQRRFLEGYNGGVSSTSASARPLARIVGSTQTANTFSSVGIYIPNYSGSASKSVSIDQSDQGNNAFVTLNLQAARWTGTSAITEITLALPTGSLAQNSTASLYIIS